MNFEHSIFDYFGHNSKQSDTNKDGNEKGTLERFNEIVGKDIDDNVITKLDNMMAALYDPNTGDTRFLPLLESLIGVDVFLSSNEVMRRRVLKNIIKLYKYRGTKIVFDVLFKWLGVTYTIVVLDNNKGLDNTLETFDSDNRTLDSSLLYSTNIIINLYGTLVANSAFMDVVHSILDFNLPITVRVVNVTYNGSFSSYSSAFSTAFTGGSI